VSCFIVAGIDHVVVYSFLAKINSDSVGQPKSVGPINVSGSSRKPTCSRAC